MHACSSLPRASGASAPLFQPELIPRLRQEKTDQSALAADRFKTTRIVTLCTKRCQRLRFGQRFTIFPMGWHFSQLSMPEVVN